VSAITTSFHLISRCLSVLWHSGGRGKLRGLSGALVDMAAGLNSRVRSFLCIGSKSSGVEAARLELLVYSMTLAMLTHNFSARCQISTEEQCSGETNAQKRSTQAHQNAQRLLAYLSSSTLCNSRGHQGSRQSRSRNVDRVIPLPVGACHRDETATHKPHAIAQRPQGP
jgi:hypothetical protein